MRNGALPSVEMAYESLWHSKRKGEINVNCSMRMNCSGYVGEYRELGVIRDTVMKIE